MPLHQTKGGAAALELRRGRLLYELPIDSGGGSHQTLPVLVEPAFSVAVPSDFSEGRARDLHFSMQETDPSCVLLVVCLIASIAQLLREDIQV